MKRFLPLALLLLFVPFLMSWGGGSPISKKNIPAIDANAPKEIETATFAVG